MHNILGDGSTQHPGQSSWRGREASWRTIKEHFYSEITRVKDLFGWTKGGFTGNLSGEEGAKVDSYINSIKSIVQDLEKEKEDKEAVKKLKEKCDRTEQTILMKGLSENSRGTRKRKSSDTGSTNTSSLNVSRLSSCFSSQDEAFFRSFGISSEMKAEGCNDENVLVQWFEDNNSDYYELVRGSKCDVGVSMSRGDIESMLEGITFQIIANTYSRDGKGPELAKEQQEKKNPVVNAAAAAADDDDDGDSDDR